MRRAGLVLAMLANIDAVSAQSPTQPSSLSNGPTFEVASVKQNNSGSSGFSGGLAPGGRFELVNAPTVRLIRLAYPTETSELVGAPEWVTSERYDVAAVAGPETTRAEMQAMLRALLEERFKLLAHQEMRERPTFSLMLARSDGRLGPQMRRTEYDCAAIEAANRRNEPAPLAANGAPPCGVVQQGGTLRGGGITMGLLSQFLSSPAGRPVVDHTGLTDSYELTLRYSIQPVAGGGAAADDAPSIFTALPEQLGLKLEPATAPLPVLVIDRIERPSEN